MLHSEPRKRVGQYNFNLFLENSNLLSTSFTIFQDTSALKQKTSPRGCPQTTRGVFGPF